MATTKAATTDPNHLALLNTPTLRIRMLQLTLILSCCRLHRLGLSTCFQGPIAPCALFFSGKSHTYICPSIPVGPHKGHVMCHWRCPKEWLKGVVVTTLSGYCLFHLFSFPCFHDLLSQPIYCPCLFVPLLQACAHALTSPTHLSDPYSLFPKCTCQSCINNGPCPLVCSPVSLS